MLKENYLIIGDGVSGSGVINYLNKHNANIFLLAKSGSEYENVTNVKKIDKSLSGFTAIVSAGISTHNKIYNQLKKFNIECSSELEHFGSMLTGSQIVVTGTNGKTTTTMLIEKMLHTGEKDVKAIGNIGKSIAGELEFDNNQKFYVIEASSFMLEKIVTYKPNVAVFLNFAPDHLNHHKNLNEYFNAKCEMFKNMGESDIAILNFDDDKVREIHTTLQIPYMFFSTSTELENGAYIKNQKFYFCGEEICDTAITHLIGEHNLSNILASICVAKYYGVSNEQISVALSEFHAPMHRLEKLYSHGGMVFYNSSKATNVASAKLDINAIDGDKIILLGGSDKGEKFNNLFEDGLEGVKVVICYGKTKNKIFKSASKFKQTFLKNVMLIKAEHLNDAINIAIQVNIKINASIVLAPACASFDEFNNYKERGEFFKNVIKKF